MTGDGRDRVHLKLQQGRKVTLWNPFPKNCAVLMVNIFFTKLAQGQDIIILIFNNDVP